MTKREKIGKLINKLKSGHTNTWLAAKLSCSPSNVSRMISGKITVDTVDFVKIANICGYDVYLQQDGEKIKVSVK